MLVTAEVRGGTRWETISAKEALRLNPSALIRCPECHGSMQAWKGGIGGPRFVHITRHTGCSRAERFDGTPRMHPNALE